jgi:hypothetical protein
MDFADRPIDAVVEAARQGDHDAWSEVVARFQDPGLSRPVEIDAVAPVGELTPLSSFPKRPVGREGRARRDVMDRGCPWPG